MGRSQESYNKKEVRNKKEKKRKEKAKKRQARRDDDKKGGLDDMIAYVDEYGNISDTPPDPDQKKAEIKAEDVQIGAANQNTGKADEDPIRTGRITFFNHTKGFGFIEDKETRQSVFVHINNSHDELNEGNMVNYEVEMGPKGLAANNVKIIK